MKTITCPKCKETIQNGAKKCKHCWADLRNWFRKHYIITTFLVLVLLWSIISATSSSETSNNQSPLTSKQQNNVPVDIVSIWSIELYQEYEANEIKADEMYWSKIIEVTGAIQSIGKDFLDDMYVLLEGDGVILGIQCMLKDSEKSKAVELTEWQEITVQWKVWSKIGNLVMRSCIIK